MIKILFVCLGNICRSPMAEFVFKDLVKKHHLENNFYIQSAATSKEEYGNPVHPWSHTFCMHDLDLIGCCTYHLIIG